MEDPFFAAASDLDKILDDFEESERPAVNTHHKPVQQKTTKNLPVPLPSPSPIISNSAASPEPAAVVDHISTTYARSETNAPVVSSNHTEPVPETDMLIDFSSPEVALPPTPQASKQTLNELDFLLSLMPSQQDFITVGPDKVNKPENSAGEIKDTLMDDENLKIQLQTVDVQSSKPAVNNGEFISPTLNKQNQNEEKYEGTDNSARSASHEIKDVETASPFEQHMPDLPTAAVGFTDNVHIDDEEFLQFMAEEGDAHGSSNEITSELNGFVTNTNDVEAAELTSTVHENETTEVKPDLQLDNISLGDTENMIKNTNASESKASVTTQGDSASSSNTDSLNNHVNVLPGGSTGSNSTRPKMQKIFQRNTNEKKVSPMRNFQNDTITSAATNYVPTSPTGDFPSASQNSMQIAPNDNDNIVIEGGTFSGDSVPSTRLAENHSVPSTSQTALTSLPADSSEHNVNAESQAQHPALSGSSHGDHVRPNQLSVSTSRESQVRRIPSVSPPSYSSVIAGDYSAGTIIQQDPSMNYQTSTNEQVPSSSHRGVPSTSVQQPNEATIEHGIEATEDTSPTTAPDSDRTTPSSSTSTAPTSLPPHMVRPGHTKPRWVPDEESPTCTKCQAKFSFTRRRHHCRACGRVFCSTCCSEKSKLHYLDYSEARVCILCYTSIVQADAMAATTLLQGTQGHASGAIPIATQPHASTSPRPVLKSTDDPSDPSTPKSVRFVDGTRPDHPAVLPDTPPLPARNSRSGRSKPRSNTLLPPVVMEFADDGSYVVDEDPDPAFVSTLLKSGGELPVSFVMSANLFVLLRLIQYGSTSCYYFISLGLDSVGQSEVALLLQVNPDNDSLPIQAFTLYSHLFNNARKGKSIHANDYMPTTDFLDSTDELFGSNKYAGIIYVRRTCQNVENLSNEPIGNRQLLASTTVTFPATLFALLVHKAEVPWANLFPSRLLLGLGAKYKQFPYPLMNMHNRSPVYFEVANTILGILCDFRNFKYRVISVPGISVVVKKSGVVISIPCNRFSDILKIMNSSNEHVLALGAETFISEDECESHLVCIQNQSTYNYHTEVISCSQGENVKSSAGAAFVVFNGSLKSGTTQQAKCTVVEDGVMIQLHPEKMAVLKESLKAMDDFSIMCTPPSAIASPVKHKTNPEDGEATEVQSESLNNKSPEAPCQSVELKWVGDDTKFNIGLSSPIDFRSFEGVVGYNVQGKSEKKGKHQVLRWNQVFFFKSTSDILDMSRLAERVANGCFQALVPHVKLLRDSSQMKIGIRINIHPDDVGYAVGSHGIPLPDPCLNALDDSLIPLVHDASSSLSTDDEPVMFELIFYILEMRSAWKTVQR